MTASDKINILIVEDNEDHLFFIKKVLSDENYALQHIVSGTEAYNYLLNPKIKPDVVLLDNHLPGMSGLEILKKLGSKKDSYGFIFTTVDTDTDIVVEAMTVGALDFLPKTPEYFYLLPQKIEKIYQIQKEKIEKRKLKKVLKTQQKALETAEEMAMLGSFTLDLLTYKGQISKAFKTITGFKENRTIDFHKGWRRIVHPEDVNGNQKALDKALKTGVFNHTYRIITLDTHQIKWIHSLGKVIYKNKNPISFIGAIQDITTRKLAEQNLLKAKETLEKSEIKYRNLFEKNKAVMLIIDPVDGAILDANPAACNYYGWRKDELISKKISDINILPREVIQKEMALAKSAKKNYFNFEHRLANGQVHQVEVYSTPIKVSNKILLHTIVHDITQRKLAEVALRKSEDKLGSLYENAPLSYQSLNKEGYLVDVNLVWLKTLGYKRKEVINKHVTKFLTPESTVLFKKQFPKFKASGLLKNSIFKMIKKDGSIITISINGNVSKDDSGNFKQTYCNFIDVTQLKKQELTKGIIINITKKANEALPQKELFDFIRLELGKVIDTTNFYIALGNKESEYLTIPYMHDEKDRKSDFPKRNSLSGYVIDTQKSLLINNLNKKNKKILEQGPTSKCWLGAPLIINNNVIGLMTVQSYTDENAYTQDDVTLLELVASNISQVIGKSQDLERINLLSHALTQSAEAVIITDVNGDIQYVNPAFSILSGYTEEEALGQNPRIIKSGDQPKAYYEKLWNTILSGDNWQGEFINKRKDGTKYLVNANISPIKNKEEIITHFVGVQEDITEKRKLERDLIHAFIDAQEEEKISFGEDLHDGISQILSAEAMFIQVLIQQNKDVLNAQSLKYLESVKDLNIKAINEARSIAHGLMSKQLKENGLLKAIAHICKDYNGSKNIVFKYRHKGLKETDIAKAIKINIFRIIQEISTNTIRHSGAKKAEISLSKTQNNMLQLIYSDNGVGIDFERMKQEKKGAGLKNIERRVTLLKGTYTLDSVLNKGIKYTIEVPLFNI